MLDGDLITLTCLAAAGEVTVGFACMFVFIRDSRPSQRDDDVGAPRRRGGDRRVDVDVRRPSTNASRSKAGAV